jgi:hypothetical protein
MSLGRIFILWFLRFGALLSIIGIGMAFMGKDAYVNLFIYAGTGSVIIGCILMLFLAGRDSRRPRKG